MSNARAKVRVSSMSCGLPYQRFLRISYGTRRFCTENVNHPVSIRAQRSKQHY
jgi:hypothetical protein